MRRCPKRVRPDACVDGPRHPPTSTWPIHSGGKISAVQAALAAEVQASTAQRRGVDEQIEREPVQRCFGLRTGGALLRERERALPLVLATSVPLLFLPEQIFSAEAIPAPVRAPGALAPTTPGIAGFLKFNQMGASVGEALPELLHMGALLVLYAGLAWMLWRRLAPSKHRAGTP
jgi:hypothetical protein